MVSLKKTVLLRLAKMLILLVCIFSTKYQDREFCKIIKMEIVRGCELTLWQLCLQHLQSHDVDDDHPDWAAGEDCQSFHLSPDSPSFPEPSPP